jgi:putative ABC transport system permease protein
LGIKIKEGRNFSKNFPTDKQAFILNEAAVKLLHLSNPVGTELSLDPRENFGKVIGVVKDFNYKSPHTPVEPLAIALCNFGAAPGSKIMLKVQANNIPSSIEFIEQKWKQYFPQYPVRYFFLDDEFNKQYHKDNTMLVIFSCFSGLTILISCLGLFGLASFTTEQRTKEIGIRKVLGASVSNITYLISRDFILLVLLGIAIATPIAYYALTKWLENYAYHTNLTIGIFIIAGFLALLVAFITVSSQAVKAAITNPTKSLRSE